MDRDAYVQALARAMGQAAATPVMGALLANRGYPATRGYGENLADRGYPSTAMAALANTRPLAQRGFSPSMAAFLGGGGENYFGRRGYPTTVNPNPLSRSPR